MLTTISRYICVNYIISILNTLYIYTKFYISDYFKTPISNEDAIKLLYMVTNGVPSARDDKERDVRLKEAEEVAKVMKQAIQDQSFDRIHEFLYKQLETLKIKEYPNTPKPSKWKNILQLIRMIESIRYLALDSDIKKKFDSIVEPHYSEDSEPTPSATIYNENLVMMKICEALSENQALALWEMWHEFCQKNNRMSWLLDKSLSMLDLKAEGMKTLLVLYTFRSMELSEKLNIIFADLLIKFLKKISKEENNGNFEDIYKMLETYTVLTQCPGYCLIFCVKEKRPGAEMEIQNLKTVFEDTLHFKVNVINDPTESDIVKQAEKCTLPTVEVYDSFVCWFLGHGNSEDLVLSGGKKIKRDDFIKEFEKLSVFPKKPKLFFMGSCQGEERIEVDSKSHKGLIIMKIFNSRPVKRTFSEYQRENNLIVRY